MLPGWIEFVSTYNDLPIFVSADQIVAIWACREEDISEIFFGRGGSAHVKGTPELVMYMIQKTLNG